MSLPGPAVAFLVLPKTQMSLTPNRSGSRLGRQLLGHSQAPAPMILRRRFLGDDPATPALQRTLREQRLAPAPPGSLQPRPDRRS